MMAFSACIGFGLFLQSGKVIYIAGPGLAVVAVALAASVMWSVIACLGEVRKALVQSISSCLSLSFDSCMKSCISRA
jgi:amino acid permease